MMGPITIQTRPGSAGTQAEVKRQLTAAAAPEPEPERQETGGKPLVLPLGMKKWVVSVKEPFPAREVARTLRL